MGVFVGLGVSVIPGDDKGLSARGVSVGSARGSGSGSPHATTSAVKTRAVVRASSRRCNFLPGESR